MKCSNEEILNNKQRKEKILLEEDIPLVYSENSEIVNEKRICENQHSEKIREDNNSLRYFLYLFLAILLTGVMIFLLNFILASNLFSNNNLIFKSDKAIKHPKSDYKKYRSMYLKNGLLAIIISDPLTTTSGASLSVRVGAMSDPDKLQGLAHFCEHMLFLGSKKYPNGDDYFKTVSENNGHFNAYTDREMTNYFFDIHYLSFESALDIFSRFFIDPLFKEEKLNKEINSVNSEYEKNLIIDSRKRSQIFAYLTDADDPYHRFTTGNIETLLNSAKENGMNLRDELLKFHKKYYTSDKMKLVIYTNEDIEDMEEIVVEKFSLIQPSEEYINMNSNADLSTKSFEHKQTQNVNNSVIDSINNFNDKHNNTANLFLGKVSVNENKNKNSVCLNNYNMNESRKANKSLLPAIFVDKKSLFCEKNINSKERYDFQSPFSKNILGTLISYQALTQEYDLNIAFIQKSLRSHQYYNINPSVYFSFLMDSKEENSLINSLKKRNLASKLQVSSEREYDKWSDLVLDITLTEKGIQNLDKVFMLISNYLSYMRDNLISQEYFNYLKKVEDLKFQEKNLLSHNIYDIVSKSSARAHHYPITYILKENIFEGEFDMPSLNEYARNLILENSLIFIPDKHFNSTADKYDFLQATNTSYEPWYKTNYNLYKIDFTILNKKFESSPLAPITKKSEDKKEEKADTQSMVEKGLNTTLAGLDINKAVNQTSSIKIPTTFSGPKLYEEEAITNILSNMSYKCDLDCIEKLESFNTKEPDLLNKTATFELWHKQEFTLDFNKMLLDVQFVYDSYKNHMEKVLISLLQTYVKRKLKRFSTLLKIFSSSLSISKDSRGLKLSFECINEPNLRKKFFEELARKMFGIFNTENISEFNFIMQETKDKVNKEYNSQPYVVAYDYLKDNTLEDHIRFDQQLKILEEIKFEDFKNFIKKFEKKVYFKFLFFGSIDEKNTRSLFGNFNELIALPKPETPKKIFSIAEKRKNKQSVLKLDNGNYLIRKLYHQEKNKNNCFLKCYFVDKKNFKSEIMVKLFNSIIGNIVFRELRINRQFGYVAKSRYEVFNDQLFYCIFVQGSSKLPHIIDDAAEEVLKMIQNKINQMSSKEFLLSKRKNFDVIASDRFSIDKIASRYFNTIVSNKYNFYNFLNMENYSKGITHQDLKNFFDKTFSSQSSASLTVYMYSKFTKETDRLLSPKNYINYEEFVDENDENDVKRANQ